MSADQPDTTAQIHRHERSRPCYCSTCYERGTGRRRNIRCGRGPFTDVWWTVGTNDHPYRRRKDAVRKALEMTSGS